MTLAPRFMPRVRIVRVRVRQPASVACSNVHVCMYMFYGYGGFVLRVATACERDMYCWTPRSA